jgi:hypothetical protein
MTRPLSRQARPGMMNDEEAHHVEFRVAPQTILAGTAMQKRFSIPERHFDL